MKLKSLKIPRYTKFPVKGSFLFPLIERFFTVKIYHECTFLCARNAFKMHTGDLVNKPGGTVTSCEPPKLPGLPAVQLSYFPRSRTFHQTKPNQTKPKHGTATDQPAINLKLASPLSAAEIRNQSKQHQIAGETAGLEPRGVAGSPGLVRRGRGRGRDRVRPGGG